MNYQRNPMRYPNAIQNVEPGAGRRPMNNGGGCGCCEGGGGGDRSALDCLAGMSLAMVYSPCQEFENLYGHADGIKHGTIFRDLDKPFTGRRGGC